jgi:hypothetical protein
MPSDESPKGRPETRGKLIGVLRAISDLLQLPQQTAWLVGVVVTGGGIAAGFVLRHDHQISVALAWTIAVASSLSGVVVLARSSAVPRRAGTLWHDRRRLGTSLGVFALTSALVTGAGWSARALAHQMSASRCAPPVDLRVLTAPETLTAIRWAADAFTADGAGRCGQVRIAVAPSGSLTSLTAGFQNGWYTAPGGGETSRGALQPDIIIPGSSAEVPHLAQDHQPGVRLTDEGSVGTSPLAVAISADAESDLTAALGGIAQPTLKDLLTTARTYGVRSVLRASPDVSEIGALATADLYATKALGDTDKKTEQVLANTAFPLGDSVSSLCGLRARGSAERVAVIAPEQVLAEYVNGHPLGDACPGGNGAGPALTIHYPSDAHVLDYPFVHVTWAGQDSTRRSAQIERFRRWLGDGRLRQRGFRDATGKAASNSYAGDRAYPGQIPRLGAREFTPAVIDQRLGEIAHAWPPMHVVLAVDDSGSMSGGRSEGGSRFTYAVQLARSAALNVVHDPDTGELDVFSRTPGKSPFRRLTAPRQPPNRPDIDAKLSSLVPQGSDIPLYDAIEQAAKPLAAYANSAAVVFTDGGSQGGDLAAAAQRLRGRLRRDAPPIIVLTGVQTCAQSRPIKALGTAVTCVETAADETNDIMASILGAAR